MSNLPGLQRALEIMEGIPLNGYASIHKYRDILLSEIEKEKAKEVHAPEGEGKAFTSLYEANQELNPTNTVWGSLANKPPIA